MATTVVITLSSGQAFSIIYEWTFGEMAITAALCLLTVLYAVHWLYDIIFSLWTWRRTE